MTRPTQYLIRMAVFVAVVVAATALLFGPVADAFMANPALNGLILGVLLIGIAYNFRHVLRLFREIAWIRSVQGPAPGRGAPEPARPQLLATLATAFSSEAPVRFSAVSMRSILDGVASRVDEASETARYLAGLLIFLGLIGTFWGLIQTVSAIGDVIGGLEIAAGSLTGVFEELKTGLDAPLAGMGTAFSSSLFGLSGALVLGFLDLQASQASSRFVNELEEWLSSLTRLGSSGPGFVDGDHSVPTYIQALLETTAENLEDLRRIVGRAEEGRHSVNRNIEALSETLAGLAEQLGTSQAAHARLAEEQIETQALLRRVLETRQRGGMDETTRRHIASLDSALLQMRDELRAGRSELTEDLRTEIKLLARTVSARLEDRR
ncbi:MAG: flagellar motor protein MotA [Alphaproteobacteria bacterium]|nr:flagellar motor protein MotA [Alphaproteobacteria bacterium]